MSDTARFGSKDKNKKSASGCLSRSFFFFARPQPLDPVPFSRTASLSHCPQTRLNQTALASLHGFRFLLVSFSSRDCIVKKKRGLSRNSSTLLKKRRRTLSFFRNFLFLKRSFVGRARRGGGGNGKHAPRPVKIESLFSISSPAAEVGGKGKGRSEFISFELFLKSIRERGRRRRTNKKTPGAARGEGCSNAVAAAAAAGRSRCFLLTRCPPPSSCGTSQFS